MLALALICTAVAALANWSTRVRPNERLETVSKPLTTILVIWIAIAADGPRGSTVLAVIGLLFCLAGDIALLDLIDQFVVGLAAFLVGHIVFIAMFVTLHLRHPWWGLIAAVVVAAHAVVVGRRIVAGAAAQDASLRTPVSAYLVVITSMTVIAVMTGRWWAVAGAIAFVISDTILGWRAFVRERSWMALAVMMTYHAALVGLALSLRGA
ncbi:MAG: putative rane protein [Ilumatobacteraceae bacterium]|nr:putative rane protein [Ilumatobacteraceae bacterium]